VSENIEMVKTVAHRLGDLREDVVFLGGAVVGLLTTDPAVGEARPTKDVDIIVNVASRADYAELETKLRVAGFVNDRSEDAPICRWLSGDVKVDVMPTDLALLGFGNRWYAQAIAHAETRKVGKLHIRVVSAPYFLATKLEAFAGRGDGDYRASHDLEDLITLIDGRPELPGEALAAAPALRAFLGEKVGALLDEPEFLDALPGHLRGDAASQDRDRVVLARMKAIAGRPA
jgi:hypothetical protein